MQWQHKIAVIACVLTLCRLDLQRTVKKCTEIYNAQFGDVLDAVSSTFKTATTRTASIKKWIYILTTNLAVLSSHFFFSLSKLTRNCTCSWNSALFAWRQGCKQFTQKDTSLLEMWRSRQRATQNLMTALSHEWAFKYPKMIYKVKQNSLCLLTTMTMMHCWLLY